MHFCAKPMTKFTVILLFSEDFDTYLKYKVHVCHIIITYHESAYESVYSTFIRYVKEVC